MNFNKFRKDLRRNGYAVGYIDSTASKALVELFNDLSAVMGIVDNGDPDAPLRQKVLELKILHQSNGYDLRNKEHFFKNKEQDVDYQSMIEENIKLQDENRKQKLKLDQTIDKLSEALKKAKNFSDLIVDLEEDFKQFELYRDNLEDKDSQKDNCGTQKLDTSQKNVVDLEKKVPKKTDEELKTECNQLQIQVDSFRKQVEEKNSQLLANDKEIASNKEKIESYRKSIDTLKTDYEKKCLNLNNAIKTKEDAMINLEVYIDDVIEEFRKFQEKVFSKICNVCLKTIRSNKNKMQNSFNSPFGSTPATTTSSLFSFGTPSANTATQPLSFGTPNTGTQPLSFGTPNTGTQPLTFGTPNATATTTTSLLFGTPATTIKPTLSFGTPAVTTATAPAVSQQAAGFSFGTVAPSTQSSQPVSGLRFGIATTTASSLFSGSKLGATTTSTAAPTFSLFPSMTQNLQAQVTTSTATTTVPLGLGGSSVLTSTRMPITSTSLTQPNESAAVNNSVTDPKQNAIPNEIMTNLESFKNVMKKQREISSEIACGSIKPANETNEEMAQIEKILAVSENDLKKIGKQVVALKSNMTKLLHYVDLVHKHHGFTYDSLSGQMHYYNSNFVSEYFVDLVREFEDKIQNCKSQFDQIEQIAFTLNNQDKMAPEDLTDCLRVVQDIFTSVAGQLHQIQMKVQTQKRSFLDLRRNLCNDTRNVFEKPESKSTTSSDRLKITPGPTPFSVLMHTSDNDLSSSNNIDFLVKPKSLF